MSEHEPESEREIVVSRLIEGPPALVFEVFTAAQHVNHVVGARWLHDHDARLRLPRRRRVGLHDARPGRRRLPELD
jgi:uncharacterized protein YndB with AHSA1/START domain